MARLEGPAGDRVYRAIKTHILDGEARLRERLDVDTLARRLGVSATPVRQALMRLSMERLVVAEGARGYHVKLWSEAELAALYAWRGALARLALELWTPGEGVHKPPARASHVEATEALFRELQKAAHDELTRAAANADERLRAARRIEAEVFANAGAELKSLTGLMRQGDRRRLQAALRAYHQRRIKAAPAIRSAAALRALPPGSV